MKGRATLGDLVISTHLLQTRLLCYPAVKCDLINFGGIADVEGQRANEESLPVR